jgi:membrane protein DedA with SNARE-associated domain
MDQALALILQFKYLILFPLAAFEGPVVSLIAGFLVYTGQLNPYIAFVVLILGDVIPDSVYYFIGRFGNAKNLHSKVRVISNNFKRIETMWSEHGKKTMFLGKLAYGLSHFFLISAGLVKMPFRKFVAYAVLVTFFQFGILMALGYYLGGSYQAIASRIKGAEILIGALAVLIFVGYFTLSKRIKEWVLKTNKSENEGINSKI